METSFCELKGKEVINVVDGRRLGKIIDIVFDTQYGRVLGIVVPSYNKSFNIFKQSDDIFIPFNCICKFGEDTILVQIYITDANPKLGKKGRFVKMASTQAPDVQTAQNVNASQSISAPQNINAANMPQNPAFNQTDFNAENNP